MKLCKDCKHYLIDYADWIEKANAEKWPICSRKIFIDPVTGLPKKNSDSLCSVERIYPPLMAFFARECGKSGRYWEAK